MAWGGRGSASPLPNDEAVSSRAGFVCALLPVHRGPAGRWQQSSASAERAKATGDIPCCMSQPCVTAPSPQRGAASPPCTAGSCQAAPGEHGGELGLYGLKDPPFPLLSSSIASSKHAPLLPCLFLYLPRKPAPREAHLVAHRSLVPHVSGQRGGTAMPVSGIPGTALPPRHLRSPLSFINSHLLHSI